MKFNKFYITNNEGKSNCVIRAFCKIFNKEYENVYNDLCIVAKQLECDSFNEIQVFEKYMENHSINLIDYGKDMQIKDLSLDSGNYVIFCWNKKEFYHMVPVINNILYDKDDKCLELYAIKIYKQNN